MTEKEYKKLENQKWEILAQLQKADEEKQAIKIRQNEQKYVGKCYRIQRNYEFYANKFKKSHMNTLDIHEMFNPESVDNRMEWFIELLRHNIHVDKSLIPE